MSSSAAVQPTQRPGHLIFVLGAPGAGKGTHSKLLANDATLHLPRHLRVQHTSVGDLLRKQKAAQVLSPALAQKVDKQILMDGADITEIMANSGVLDAGSGGGNVVVLDGFPRNMDQLRAFSQRFGEPDLVLSFSCPREVAMRRYLARHDATRPDGDEALFVRRCDEFERENPGILAYYQRSIPGRVLEIEVGSEQGVSECYGRLRETLITCQHGPWYVT